MSEEKLFEIKHRLNGSVLFSLKCGSKKLCLEAGVRTGINLSSAHLGSADLSYADLTYADLGSADLSSADLSSADLSSADLGSADLSYANLRYANLSYAKSPPIVMYGLTWNVLIAASGMLRIGCERHSPEEWEAFTADKIRAMDSEAESFAAAYLTQLIALAKAHRERWKEKSGIRTHPRPRRLRWQSERRRRRRFITCTR